MDLRRISAVVMVACAVSPAGCGGIIDPSKNTVETFSGTLAVGSSFTSPFYSFSKNGEVEVTMTSVTPTPTNGSISMALGQVVSGSCQLLGVFYTAPGVVNRKNQFGVLNKGTYCIVVFDPGGVLTVPVNFSGTISHP